MKYTNSISNLQFKILATGRTRQQEIQGSDKKVVSWTLRAQSCLQ
ncbi:hypothetical protein LLB_0145 [Legionella longbeachae D-4968]|nr:hypothetical protein LLB_0145 [Legionella longbeachae D-4968]